MSTRRKYLSKPRRFSKAKTIVSTTRRTNAVRSVVSRTLTWRPTGIFKISQIFDASYTSSTTTPTATSYVFQLNQLDQYTTLSALFDQFRFHRVSLTFKPRVTQVFSLSGAIGANIYTVIDYDDNTNLTTASVAREYGTCQENGPHETFTRALKPKCAVATYNGAFTGYGNPAHMWFDVASSNIMFYGLKVFVPTCSAVQVWDLIVTYEMEFKSVR
jgi:hypothetical protein